MKITQSWKRNTPTTDGYSLTVTYVYSSKYLHEIEEIEKKLPKGMIVMDTDKPTRCKDCKYYDSFSQECRNGIDGIMTPNFYCGNAERKEGR